MNSLITFDGDMPLLDADTASEMAFLQALIETAESQLKSLREAVLKAMEESGTIKLETDNMTVSYIAPTDREVFDKAKFKKEHSDLYDSYINMRPVKASVRITLKDVTLKE